jgi:tripartite-type tricarboxylate transporter receptor subunit TctC
MDTSLRLRRKGIEHSLPLIVRPIANIGNDRGKRDETQRLEDGAGGRICPRGISRGASAEFPVAARDPYRPLACRWQHRRRDASARERGRKAFGTIDRGREPARRFRDARSGPNGGDRKTRRLHDRADSDHRLPFSLHDKTTFDPSTDFTYIIGVSGYTFGVVVRDDAPWKSFQDLTADAKSNPGKINYGTPGAGTSLHITMEQIARQQGIKWTHVPFKGNAESMNALLGGHIHVVADSSGWAQLVNAGRFRLLVTWGVRRTKNWPDVPTLREIGIDMVSNSPFGIAGPKGMDPKIVRVLHDAFKQGLEEPSYAAAVANLDQELFYLSSEDYQNFAMRQIEEARRFITELGLGPKQE